MDDEVYSESAQNLDDDDAEDDDDVGEERALLSQESFERRLSKKASFSKKSSDKDQLKHGKTLYCPSVSGWWWSWGHAKITVISADGLPLMPWADVPDSFVRFCADFDGHGEYCGRTQVINNKHNPAWNVGCKYPRPWDASKIKVKVVVWDDNSKGFRRGSDDKIGSAEYTFKLTAGLNKMQKKLDLLDDAGSPVQSKCILPGCYGHSAIYLGVEMDRTNVYVIIVMIVTVCCVLPLMGLLAKIVTSQKGEGARSPGFEMGGVPLQSQHQPQQSQQYQQQYQPPVVQHYQQPMPHAASQYHVQIQLQPASGHMPPPGQAQPQRMW